jgi:hypothetical protein
MFVDAGPGIRIFCDYKSRVLRVQENQNPIFGWTPIWREVAKFSSPATWYASEFSKTVAREEFQEDVAWFWSDLSSGQKDDQPPS